MYSIPYLRYKSSTKEVAASLLLPLLLALGTATQAAKAGEPLPLSKPLQVMLKHERPESVADLRYLQEQVRQVVDVVRPVTVSVELNDSAGSGVIISADGLVMTAGHVSALPNRKVWLRFPDNTRVQALSLGVNHNLDSGLIRILDDPPTEEGWPFVPIAASPAKPGDWVVAVGQPNGFVADRAPPVRLGRVLHSRDEAMISTDATLVGGDSGGPLMNLSGEVVGIHSRIGEQITNNFHVAVAAYQREWDRLLAGRMTGTPDGEEWSDWRPQIGLALRFQKGGLQSGACVVTQVFPDSAAAEAGVQVGDILQSFAGETISDAATLSRLATRQEAFNRVSLQLERDGKEQSIELWLGRTAIDFPGIGSPEMFSRKKPSGRRSR